MVVLFADTNKDHVVSDCYVWLCCLLIPIKHVVLLHVSCSGVVLLFADTNTDHVRTEDCYHVVRTARVVVLFADTNKDHAGRTATCGCVVL